MASVHAEGTIAGALHRRAQTGAPLGECGNCREDHGHPKNCLAPSACIHGYAHAKLKTWAGENPAWGKGRSDA